jgi:pSer/pThr/pTyr-binding forkhead associated (FHA) protein
LIDTDTSFKRYCVINTQQVNVVIGRGDADINIKHPVISRSHARLQSDGKYMTLSDLGSSTGTFIKGTPCLQDEVMYIEAEDEIFLGDVRLRFSIIKKETDLP